MAIKIDIIGNVDTVLRGQDKIVDKFEATADSLDDLATKGKAAGSKLGDGVKDGTRSGDAGLDKLQRSFRDMEKVARNTSDGAGDAFRKNIKKGTDGAEEGLDEFRDEANSTAREAAASFDGSAESIADAFQEVAANALAGFGPLGAVAGLALAAGLGIAISQGTKAAEALNDAQERAGELANELAAVDGDISQVDIASKIREWGVAINDDVQFWEVWQKSAVSNVEAVQRQAREAGVDFETLFRGKSGYSEADRVKALDAMKSKLEDVQRQMERNREVNPFAGFSDNVALDFQTTSLRNMITELEAVPDVSGDAVAANEALTEATKANAAAVADRNAKLDDAYAATRSAASANLEWIDTLASTTEAIAKNGRTVDENSAAGRANQKALIDLASAVIATRDANYQNGEATDASNAKTREGRDAFLAAADAAGYTAEQARELADSYGLVPEQVSTQAIVNGIPAIERDLANLVRERRTAVQVGADTSEFDRQIRAKLNEKRTATILVRSQMADNGSGRMGVP
jgi:hypothetical protein